MYGKWGKLGDGTVFSGRLILGDRVYGRLTRARTHEGSFPVCLEVLSESGDRGLEVKGGGDDLSKIHVFSELRVRAVREFE